jgi:hypothetical protein
MLPLVFGEGAEFMVPVEEVALLASYDPELLPRRLESGVVLTGARTGTRALSRALATRLGRTVWSYSGSAVLPPGEAGGYLSLIRPEATPRPTGPVAALLDVTTPADALPTPPATGEKAPARSAPVLQAVGGEQPLPLPAPAGEQHKTHPRPTHH